MPDSQPVSPPPEHGRLLPKPDSQRYLDTQQLQNLEEAFRQWAQSPDRPDFIQSRSRILLIFLLIRYTGGRLNEILSLDPVRDLDLGKALVHFHKKRDGKDMISREVQIPESIAAEVRTILSDTLTGQAENSLFQIDPAHVRRKFYERATSIGIPQGLGAPESIRKSRAVELMRSNMPLPVVQKILGHSTPNLAASYVEFSDTEIRQVARYFADRENLRKTSARNSFLGKITAIRKGDIQTIVEISSLGGATITAIITSDSLTRIGLKPGMLITAEVKAPWVQLSSGETAPSCSAENVFQGTVYRITRGRTTAEVIVQLVDGTELCSIITEKSLRRLDIREQSTLWAFFDAFAVILHVD